MAGFRWLNIPGLLVVAGVVVLWQVTLDWGILNVPYVSTPSGVVSGMKDLVDEGDLGEAIGHTLWTVLVSLLIAGIGGLLLGLAVGLSDGVWTWSMASIDALRSVPGAALVSVMIVIFGLTGKAEIASASFAAIWVITVNTAGAVRQVHPRLHDTAKTLRLGPISTLCKIILPAAAPVILVGIRLGTTIALVVVIVTEMIGNPAGVGGALVAAQQALQTDQMWAWLIIVMVLGALLNGLIVTASRQIVGER